MLLVPRPPSLGAEAVTATSPPLPGSVVFVLAIMSLASSRVVVVIASRTGYDETNERTK